MAEYDLQTPHGIRAVVEAYARFADPQTYRLIKRRAKGGEEIRDYVLESMSDSLLLSRKYADDLVVRIPVTEMAHIKHATSICDALVDGKWDAPALASVMLRVRQHTVQVRVLARNEARCHRFHPVEIADALATAVDKAMDYLKRSKRQRSLEALPKAVKPRAVTDALDILCQGKLVWENSSGAVFSGYYIEDGTVKRVWVDAFLSDDVFTTSLHPDALPASMINVLTVEMYQKQLSAMTDRPEAERRQDAFNALCQQYDIPKGSFQVKDAVA